MERVIDASETDEQILTRTESDGLVGRSLLISPLEEHVRESERAQYVAWNKKRGVTCIHDGPDTYDPDGSYRAFVVATDARLVFVVGGDDGDGDRRFSLPYSDVLTVETTTSFLSTTLELVAVGKQRWQFACRGDLAPIETYVDRAVQSWTRVESVLDQADERAGDADAAIERDSLTTAETALTDAEQALAEARQGLRGLGPGALAWAGDRIEEIEAAIAGARRRLHASRGERAHRRARTAWDRTEYGRAYDAYERARGAYMRAQAVEAPAATDVPIGERLEAVDQECEQLTWAPIKTAREAANTARAADDIEVAVEHWETALDHYHDVVTLDWGRERRFAGDIERVQAAAAEAAAALVDARREAAEDRLDASEWFAVSGDHSAALEALEEARTHLERAGEVARELVPERRDPPTSELATVDERAARLDADSEAAGTD